MVRDEIPVEVVMRILVLVVSNNWVEVTPAEVAPAEGIWTILLLRGEGIYYCHFFNRSIIIPMARI